MSDESNVTGLPPSTTEPFLTRLQLADLMGVSPSTIDNMRREGMPSVVLARRSRRFKASAAIAWAQARGGRLAA